VNHPVYRITLYIIIHGAYIITFDFEFIPSKTRIRKQPYNIARNARVVFI